MTKIILTIGGSDPFSGGGIQTDLKTFENHQVFGLSTLTCLATAPKNHFQIHDLETSLVKEQLASIPAGSLDGIKIGLIHSEESMLQIATFLKKHAGLPVVLDPVLAFKETTSVYEKRYMQLLIEKLFPFATIITPNLKEAEYEKMKDVVLGELKNAFKPEFLNRVDDIIVFNQLKEEDTLQIVNIMLKDTISRLKEKNIDLIYDEDLNKFLINKNKNLEFGARPLRGIINREIVDKLSDELLKGEIKVGDKLKVECRDEILVFSHR